MKKRLSNKIDRLVTFIALGVIFILICKRNQALPVASGIDSEDENLGTALSQELVQKPE